MKNKIKIKEKVKIASDFYSVFYGPIAHEYGLINNEDKEIYISQKLNKQEKMLTLIHEMLHGYQDHFKINEFLEIEETEESVKRIDIIIDLIAKSFMMIAKDNPKLIKKIQRIVKE